jgi:uncharacterized protein (DUF1499 family)
MSLAAAIAGPLAARLALVEPFIGFLTLALGLLLALVALVLSVIGLARGRGGDRPTAMISLLLALTVVVGAVIAGRNGFRYPRINDITTDTARPPAYVRAPLLPENAGRDLGYPGEDFARQQRDGYGAIAPLATTLAPDAAFALVQSTARTMPDWEITREDPAAGALEAVATSRTFRFQDDVVVEVRAAGGRTEVHMRSKSRVGQGDMGANARRIGGFFAKLRAQTGWRPAT